MLYRTLLYSLLSLTALSCGNADESKRSDNAAASAAIAGSKLQTLSWLQGNWYIDYPEGVLTEQWEAVSASEWRGSSQFINKQGDTMMTEKIRLVLEDSTLWYIPTVTNQNDGKPVRFKEAVVSAEMASFENPEHDFPQRIIYRKLSAQTMDVQIEGTDKGKPSQEVFHYRKQ